MLDKFLTNITIPYSPFIGFIAMIGSIIRIVNDYKHGSKIKITLALIDIVISIFLGYFSSWFLLENTTFNLSTCSFVILIIGYLGSKIFDLISFIINKKIGYSKGDKYDC